MSTNVQLAKAHVRHTFTNGKERLRTPPICFLNRASQVRILPGAPVTIVLTRPSAWSHWCWGRPVFTAVDRGSGLTWEDHGRVFRVSMGPNERTRRRHGCPREEIQRTTKRHRFG